MKKNYWLWGVLGLAAVAGAWLLLKKKDTVVSASSGSSGGVSGSFTLSAKDVTFGTPVQTVPYAYLRFTGTIAVAGNSPTPLLVGVMLVNDSGAPSNPYKHQLTTGTIAPIAPSSSGTFTIAAVVIDGANWPVGDISAKVYLVPYNSAFTAADYVAAAPWLGQQISSGVIASVTPNYVVSLTGSPTVGSS